MKHLPLASLLLLAGCGDQGEGGGPSPGGGGNPVPAGSAAAIFDEREVNDFHLTIDPADWASIIDDTRGDEYRRATLRWKGVVLDDVGIRPSGHATRWEGNLKQPLKLKFNEFVPGQKLLGLKTLKLDGLIEGTMMRERIAYGIWRQRIPAAPRCAHAKLWVNGEYWGVYMAEERVSDDLLESRFGNDDGHLYRLMVTIPEAFADRGLDPAPYLPRPFQPETHEIDGDHSHLPAFVRTLHYDPGNAGAVLDLDQLTTFLAIEVVIQSRDGLLRDDGPPQNHYAYRRPDTGRYGFIPWDQDQTLTTDRAGLSLYHNFEKTRIASFVRETPALDQAFRAKVAEFLTALASPEVLNPRIDAIYAQIREHVHADVHKEPSNAHWDRMPDYLKSAVRLRYDSLRSQLGLP